MILLYNRVSLQTNPMNEKDPLLDELEERIAEGPVIFTPDEEFLKKVEERANAKKNRET